MRDAAAAEWILSLVTDHADSTVGDLVEEASSRGALWFWSSVLRTGCSHVWRDLSASPSEMTRLAFWGVLASWFFGFCISLILMLVAIVLRDSPPHWELLLTVLACTAAPFLAGRGVARRANGRELPAAFAVLTLKVVFCVLWVQLSALQVRRGWQPYPGIDHAFAVLCTESLFVMAGATVYRLRILAARKDASQRWGRYLGI